MAATTAAEHGNDLRDLRVFISYPRGGLAHAWAELVPLLPARRLLRDGCPSAFEGCGPRARQRSPDGTAPSRAYPSIIFPNASCPPAHAPLQRPEPAARRRA